MINSWFHEKNWFLVKNSLQGCHFPGTAIFKGLTCHFGKFDILVNFLAISLKFCTYVHWCHLSNIRYNFSPATNFSIIYVYIYYFQYVFWHILVNLFFKHTKSLIWSPRFQDVVLLELIIKFEHCSYKSHGDTVIYKISCTFWSFDHIYLNLNCVPQNWKFGKNEIILY